MNDPFNTGRSAHRLLFDFAIGLSLFDNKQNKKVLDFACGTAWHSEFLNKIGYDVYGIDIDDNVIKVAKNRYKEDSRIDVSRMHFFVMDGHHLKFEDNFFGHVFCFDSLHHMKDYYEVFSEIHRVLEPEGKAIFIEPGSRHSKSKETIEFLKNNPKEEFWIERDVILEEINNISKTKGFKNMTIKPFLDPTLVNFSFTDWFYILQNKKGIDNYMREFRRFNYEDRVIFSLTKNSSFFSKLGLK